MHPDAHAPPDWPQRLCVHDVGQYVGRIRYTRERTPGKWLWHVTVTIPGGPSFGDAKSIEEAKQGFKEAWQAFKEKHGPERLAKAYADMDHANRPDRYRRG